MAFPAKNPTLGSGKLYFAPFAEGTLVPSGPQEYFGNTPSLSMTSDRETLDHYDADNGIRTKDLSVTTSLDRTGSFACDHISPRNLAKWFLGEATVVAQAGATGQTYNITKAKKGGRYQIGRTAQLPAGVRGINVTAVTAGGTPLVNNVDYSVNGGSGGITFLNGGTVLPALTDSTEGLDVVVTYNTLSTSYNQIKSGSKEVEGQLYFEANNGQGQNFDYFWPRVKLTPDGDLELKGEDWMLQTFNIEALKLDDNTEVVYITGRAGSGV